MPEFRFRLRFDLAQAYRIGSDLDELDLLALASGEHLQLRSGATGSPIKDHARAAVVGGLYGTPDEARAAAEKCKRALLCWAVEQRVGIDFGDGKQRSMVTKAGLAILQEKHQCPVRNDIHGIDVYEHADNLKFVCVDANAQVGKNPATLIETVCREYVGDRKLTEKQLLAGEIYTSSFFDISARSRFITLVTAVEALLEPPKRTDNVQTLVEDLMSRTRQSTVEEATKTSIVGSLQWLRNDSIGQTGRSLARRLLPEERFDGQSAADFFSRCYSLRSQLLHHGSIGDGSVDTLHLANTMEAFVAHLLLASLNAAG